MFRVPDIGNGVRLSDYRPVMPPLGPPGPGGVVISGEPAWLPGPQQVSPAITASRGSDPVAQRELLNELPAFFQAYASGDSAALNRFMVRGTSLTGLGGTVTFDSIASLRVPPGGATRQITVTVIWQFRVRVSQESQNSLWPTACRSSTFKAANGM